MSNPYPLKPVSSVGVLVEDVTHEELLEATDPSPILDDQAALEGGEVSVINLEDDPETVEKVSMGPSAAEEGVQVVVPAPVEGEMQAVKEIMPLV